MSACSTPSSTDSPVYRPTVPTYNPTSPSYNPSSPPPSPAEVEATEVQADAAPMEATEVEATEEVEATTATGKRPMAEGAVDTSTSKRPKINAPPVEGRVHKFRKPIGMLKPKKDKTPKKADKTPKKADETPETNKTPEADKTDDDFKNILQSKLETLSFTDLCSWMFEHHPDIVERLIQRGLKAENSTPEPIKKLLEDGREDYVSLINRTFEQLAKQLERDDKGDHDQHARDTVLLLSEAMRFMTKMRDGILRHI